MLIEWRELLSGLSNILLFHHIILLFHLVPIHQVGMDWNPMDWKESEAIGDGSFSRLSSVHPVGYYIFLCVTIITSYVSPFSLIWKGS